jgi:hypothetical protein
MDPLQPSANPTTLEDIPEEREEENFTTKFQMRLQHLGLYFSAVSDAGFHLFFKKLPGTNLKVEIQDSMNIFIVWSVDS